MKETINIALARFFDLFKVASNRIYAALATLLVYAQTQLMEPATLEEIAALFPDQPLVVKLITILPTILLALGGTSTSKKMEEWRTTKQGRL